jgi:hypothetical protein
MAYMITESPELKGNLMNASQELNNLRYSSTKENKDNSDSEEELKPEKRRHGNSVYIHRPARTSAASIFEDNNLDSLRKKHLFIISQYERILRETSDLNKKIEDTTKKVEELTKSLKDIKEEKKKKQSDILNYLSNKESLQEIYKNKLNYIINRRNEMKSKFEDKEINLNLDQQKVQLENDNPLYNIEQDEDLEIKIEDIKKSDKAKFTEQVINFAEELFQKKIEEDIVNKIKSKVKIAYNIFFSELSSNTTVKSESIIAHFFTRIGLYISNHSLGQYSEIVVNRFLRYLLKINSNNVEILQSLKFSNKKYKEQKTEMKNILNNLKNKIEMLNEKKISYQKRIENYEKIIEENKINIQNNEDKNKIVGNDPRRKYTVYTIDRSKLRKLNELNSLGETIGKNKQAYNETKFGNEKAAKNYQNRLIINKNENFIQFIDNIDSDKEQEKNEKSKEVIIKPKKSSSKSREKQMNDKSFEVNKNGEEIMDISKDNDNKKITITKNTKVILKKMGKQPKILKTDNANTKENKKIVKKKDIKNIKTGKNMVFLDDSKDNESNISSKNLNTENLSNQKYVIIKNDIDNKNNKEKSGEKIHFRLNRSPIANNETKQIKQPISLHNNNITVKYTSDQRNKTNNITEDKKANVRNTESNNGPNTVNHPNNKPKKNLITINKIYNSEQVQTKNNTYGNKSNNVNFNSPGSSGYYSFTETSNRTNRSTNFDDKTKEIQAPNNKRYTQTNSIHNKYITNYMGEEKEVQNKTNYQFHNISQTNPQRTERSKPYSNSDVNNIYKNENSNNTFGSSTLTNNAMNNNTQKFFQKSSYDYRTRIHPVSNSNNINQAQTAYKKPEINKNRVIQTTVFKRRNEKK